MKRRSLFVLRLLQSTLDQTLQHAPAQGLAHLAQLIDTDWISQALNASGKASIRRRKLPADHALWLVIGIAYVGGRWFQGGRMDFVRFSGELFIYYVLDRNRANLAMARRKVQDLEAQTML